MVMIKKKYLVILFILSLALFLGSSSTSYAWSYDLTLSDLRNINETLGSVKVNENFYTKCQQLLNQNYDCYFYTVYDSKKTARLVGWNNNCVQDNSTNNYVSLNATYGNYGYFSQYNNGNVNGSLSDTGSYAFRFNSGYTNQNYWFVSGNYQKSDGTMLREEPYQSVNILTLTEPTSFEFINSQNYRLVQVETQATDFLYYDIPVAWTNKIIGTLNKSIFCDRISYRVSAYNKNSNQFEIIADDVTLWQYSNGNNISNFFDTDTSSTYWSSVIDMNLYRYKNCCVYLFFEHANTNTTGLVVPIYVSDSNTKYNIATGGGYIVSTDDTFSGDYLNNYNNDIDNVVNGQPINDINNSVNNINDSINSTEGADDLINSYLSGDVDSWGADLGYHPFENPFTSFLFNLVNNVYDALTRRGNVVLDFNHHNSSGWVINTDEFITPEGPLKNLIRWSMIFFYLYGNYKFFHYLLTLIETAKIDKAIATLGTDEFYDSDIM